MVGRSERSRLLCKPVKLRSVGQGYNLKHEIRFIQSGVEGSLRVKSAATKNLISDTLGRMVRDLRISVTDRCNFRCPYCMPAEISANGTSSSNARRF